MPFCSEAPYMTIEGYNALDETPFPTSESTIEKCKFFSALFSEDGITDCSCSVEDTAFPLKPCGMKILDIRKACTCCIPSDLISTDLALA